MSGHELRVILRRRGVGVKGWARRCGSGRQAPSAAVDSDGAFCYVNDMRIRLWLPVVVVLVVVLAVAPPAHAYLDPATGSMLLSALIGLVAAIALALRMFWYRLLGLRRRPRHGPPRRPPESPPLSDK